MAKKNKNKKAPSHAKAKVDVENNDYDDVDAEDSDEEEVAPRKKAASKGRDSEGSVYKIIEVVGSSPKSWEHAAQVAVSRASQTLEDLRVAEVVDQDIKIEDGSIAAYRTKLRLSFKFRD